MKNSEFDDLEIFELDRNRLDDEWMRQSKLMYHYGMKLADARERMERAKSRLDIVEAELDLDIRLHPKEYDLEKVTESAIKKNVIIREQYQSANEQVIKAQHEVDGYQAIVRALEHRKSALEALGYLIGQMYHAEPNSNVFGKKVTR